MKIIDGKAIAEEIQQEIQQKLAQLPGRKPCLGVILVGSHAPSEIYVSKKIQTFQTRGMESLLKRLPDTITEEELLLEIGQMNEAPSIDGILVQLPLPKHMNPHRIVQAIDPSKDVDGLHPTNMGKLLMGLADGFAPCTPLGVSTLLQRSGIEVAGKHAIVLGRSNLVGKPMAAILMQSSSYGNATVTIAHSKTADIQQLCLEADILIAAIGQPLFVKANMVREGAVVVDVGINKITNPLRKSGYQLVGDVDFENVKEKCSFITPVPGGVGPMTITMLLQNTFKSYLQRTKHP